MTHLDETCSQYAEAFVGNIVGEGDIPLRSALNVSALDYSPDSLHEVDRYLNRLYRNGVDPSSVEYQHVVVWCGAYIGEVIRRNAIVEYHWVHYVDYMKIKDAGLKKMMPYTLGTHIILAAADSSCSTLPINKVARYLDEGESNNIHYYTMGDISRTRKQTPASGALGKGAAASKPWWKFW